MNKNGWKTLYWVNLFKKALPPTRRCGEETEDQCEHRPWGGSWNGVFELAGILHADSSDWRTETKDCSDQWTWGADGPDSTLALLRRAGAAVLDSRWRHMPTQELAVPTSPAAKVFPWALTSLTLILAGPDQVSSGLLPAKGCPFYVHCLYSPLLWTNIFLSCPLCRDSQQALWLRRP